MHDRQHSAQHAASLGRYQAMRGCFMPAHCDFVVLVSATTVSLPNVDLLIILHVKSHTKSNVHLGVTLLSPTPNSLNLLCVPYLFVIDRMQWRVPTTIQIVARLHIIAMEQTIARSSALCATLYASTVVC
jgi:hypothetical protein